MSIAEGPSSSTTPPQIKSREKLRRVYLGGLPMNPANAVTAEDIRKRFDAFGKVLAVDMVHSAAPGFEGSLRGFAYIDMHCTRDQWNRCRAQYHGKVWKEGRKLVLEPAKKPEMERRKKRERPSPNDQTSRTKTKTGKSMAKHAPDMSLVTDGNVEGRRGWKRGRFGRPVAVMSLKALDGTRLTVDPVHFRDSLQKLFGSERPKTHSALTWFIASPAAADAQADCKLTGQEQKERSTAWASVFAASKTPFRLGLFPEAPEEPREHQQAHASPSIQAPHPAQPAIPPPSESHQEMLPDYDFCKFFKSPAEHPLSQENLLAMHAEIITNDSLYRQDFRARHKQASRLDRRKATAFSSRKIN